ncbi:MAG TPA: phosphatase domain-containing protein [Segetibacter sp.]|jgi:phosphatidate phosphatase APP1
MQKSIDIPVISKKASFLDRIEKTILHWFRLTNDPIVKVYHGYGYASHLVLFGHVFTLSPLPRKKYRTNFWTNTFALLRSFMVKPKPGATLQIIWDEKIIKVKAGKDGFFRFEWEPGRDLSPGIYKIEVQLVDEYKDTANVLATGTGSVLVPYKSQYAFISDIDDTFLISHSSNLRKRLYVLLTKNAHTRKPFEGVVNHYQLLAKAGAKPDAPNPFFYVSSSEWNLYDFIKEFTRTNKMPEGVYLLNQVKRLKQVWRTGQNNHGGKFTRIVRIIESYPDQKYVLLGDDSQQDPNIYASIVEHFPGKIICVYLRNVYAKNATNVKLLKEKIEAAGVPVCHFKRSAEAIEHSYKLGLMQMPAPEI